VVVYLNLHSFLFFHVLSLCLGYSPPGKPKLTSCRSPEKETFTCWWEPGSDGGLPTTYALYYRKENSDAVYECPDYHTAGENSCFFNKNDTSIWVNYNITVVATNALGSNFSDPVDVDVVYIVQPHTPENVTVTVMEDKDGPFLRVSWEPPRKADTRSGWITLIYELRVKLEGEEEWEEHRAGQQKMFNIFSLRSGGMYLVQVRCKPDHGFWSEWSSTTYIKVPDYFPRETSVWILIAVFSAFIFFILTWILNLKSNSVKHCLLPPVPGPKIKGFDKQLLKNGRSEEVFSALVVPGFPPTTSSDCEDLLVEYLEVYTPEEQELILEEGKDLQEGCLKSKGSPSDSDSGRGSCDSHTLLMEKCGEGEGKEEKHQERAQKGKRQQKHQTGWEEGDVSHTREDVLSPDMSEGRVKTWPSVFSPLPQYSSRPLDHQGSLETARHGLQLPGFRSTEYVEVQRVNQEDMVILQPLFSSSCQRDGHLQIGQGEDYSKVKGVDSGNMLLLQREVEVKREEEDGDRYSCDIQDRVTESCYTTSTAASSQVTGKPTSCAGTAMPVQEEMVLAANGYVDAATMLL
uniref:Prolactin receptor n=1 Tax=Myripristis murdjan TaxID=586833 RepID=A0A667YXG1_9TELE